LAKSNNITHSKNVKELERLEHEKQKNKKYANAYFIFFRAIFLLFLCTILLNLDES
jgi:hypothetical protein